MAPIQIHCCASAFPESRPKSLNHSPPDQTTVWVQKCKTYCPVDTCYTLKHILLVKHCQSTTNSIFVGTCGSKWVKAVTMRASRARRFVLVLVAPAKEAAQNEKVKSRCLNLWLQARTRRNACQSRSDLQCLAYLAPEYRRGIALCLSVVTSGSSIKAERTTNKLGMSILPAQSSVALESTKAEKKHEKVLSHLGCVKPSISRVATEWPYVYVTRSDLKFQCAALLFSKACQVGPTYSKRLQWINSGCFLFFISFRGPLASKIAVVVSYTLNLHPRVPQTLSIKFQIVMKDPTPLPWTGTNHKHFPLNANTVPVPLP